MKKILVAILLIASQTCLHAGWIFFDLNRVSRVKKNSYRVNAKTEEVTASYEHSPFERRFMLFWNGCTATNFVLGGSISFVCADAVGNFFGGSAGRAGTFLTVGIPSAFVAVKGLTQLKRVYDNTNHWNSDKRLAVGKLKDLQTQTYQQSQFSVIQPTIIKDDQKDSAEKGDKTI